MREPDTAVTKTESPIVSPQWLEERRGDPGITLLEVSRYELTNAGYREAHIPGAHFVYWKDFCWDETDREFPDSAEMARRLGALGVGDDTTLVLIGDTIQFATYPYWVLTMAGQATGVYVLDGGRQTWEAEGRPMTAVVPPPPAPVERSVGIEDASSRIGRDAVRAGLGASGRRLVDMRSDEEYSGERVSPVTMEFDYGAERKGRIPGAVHLYYERLLAPDGTFKPPDAIAAEFAAEGVDLDGEIVTYCRLSHRASLGWLLLTRVVGCDNVRVYDGSWTEWGSTVGMPIER